MRVTTEVLIKGLVLVIFKAAVRTKVMVFRS